MKGLGFSTILLGLATVLILVSVAVSAWVLYRTMNAADIVLVKDFRVANKLYMIAPTVMNVVSMALLGVLFAMG